MGFLDRARKMAERAQAKRDETQQQFDRRPGKEGLAVDHDADGRPLTPMREEPSGASPGPSGRSGEDPVPDPGAPGAPAGPIPARDGSAPDPGVPHASGATAPVGPAAPAAGAGDEEAGASSSAPTAPADERGTPSAAAGAADDDPPST